MATARYCVNAAIFAIKLPIAGQCVALSVQMPCSGCLTDYMVPAHTATHHELGLAGPFPIGMPGGETYRTKAVGISLDNEAVGISLENVTPS